MDEPTVKFVIQELTSWPIIALVMLLLLLKPIRTIVSSINNIKVGDFQLSLQRIGESLGVSTSVIDISNLNYDDLKIFLIICGEDSDYYIFRPVNIYTPKFKEMLDKLAENGLITLWDPTPPAPPAPPPPDDTPPPPGYPPAEGGPGDPPPQPQQEAAAPPPAAEPTFGFKTTDKGRKVHRALLDSIYEQLLHVKTQDK